jgi:two-component system, NarL family, sensor histidine kinase UhpB
LIEHVRSSSLVMTGAPIDSRPPTAPATATSLRGWHLRRLRQTSLRTRIFIANGAVTAVAALVLLLTPATVSSPAHLREIAVVVVGLLLILVINLLLLGRAIGPLERLASVMRRADLLNPGTRIPVRGAEAEIGDLTRAFNEMLERLEAERRDSIGRTLQAQESERLRVAQELHDEVGQSLTAILLVLDRLTRLVPEDVAREIAEARESARGSLEDVRTIAKRLRPEALDDLGLHSALIALTERLADQTGVRIERHIERGLPQLTPDCELVIYRVAQEAITNALRHADASRISLALTSATTTVTLTVSDDGAGIQGAEPSSGIQGMRERAVLIGARMSIEGIRGRGTTVCLHIPVSPASA